LLQRITGEWKVNGKTVDTKKHTPQGERITVEWLADAAEKINQCIADTKALIAEVGAMLRT
jgi:hypothetical protein